MQKRIECRVAGRVQLVMYRDFARRSGKDLNLVGTAKNELDGSVTVIAEGDEGHLQEFLTALHKGSLLARVDAVDVVWSDARGGMTDFKILYF